MRKNTCLTLLAYLLLTSCITSKKTANNQTYTFELDTLTLFDQSRNREIPVAFYIPKIDSPRVVIFSHGYGQNNGSSYLHYSYLTEYLASKGYFVASI